jgi:hypothetical protein
VQIAENVRFTLAFRAGASPAQIFQSDENFGAVGPFNCELIADDLKINRTHYVKYLAELGPQSRKVLDSSGCFTI